MPMRKGRRKEVLPDAYLAVMFYDPKDIIDHIIAPEMKNPNLGWEATVFLRDYGYITEMTDPNNLEARTKVKHELLVKAIVSQVTRKKSSQSVLKTGINSCPVKSLNNIPWIQHF